MHRIDHATRAEDLHGAGKDGFTEGSPGVTAPTVVTADIANAWQEEIANAIEARGLELDKEDNTQLAAALATPLTAAEARLDDIEAHITSSDEWGYPPNPGHAFKTRTIEFLPTMFELGATGTTANNIPWKWNPSQGRAETVKSNNTDRAEATLQLNRLIPGNCVVTAIRVLVQPGATRSSLSRVAAQLYSRAPSTYTGTEAVGAVTLQASAEDDGTTGVQSIPLLAGADMTLGYAIYLNVVSGTGDTTDDHFYGVAITYQDVGPINI